MGLFGGGESKEDKKARKVQELLNRYGVDGLTDQRDIDSVRTIATELAGTGLIEFGTAISGKPEDIAKMTYLRTLVEQNFIIIRQLDRLNRNLEK